MADITVAIIARCPQKTSTIDRTPATNDDRDRARLFALETKKASRGSIERISGGRGRKLFVGYN